MDVPSVVSLITTAVSGYKAAVETLDEAKITAATNELTAQIMHIGAEVLALQQKALQATERERTLLRENHELSEKVRQFEQRSADRDRYALVESLCGAFTYQVKSTAMNGEPLHHLCPNCLNNRALKSILQFNSSDKTFARCTECTTLYQLAEREDDPADNGSGNWMG